jgi:ATP-dependent Clp protease ATP-binding subunit ClpX
MDQVELVFTEEALERAATLALDRETGARGLRAIIEGVLLDVMYEIPSRPEIRQVVVDDGSIAGESRPVLFDSLGNEISFGARDLPKAA